MSITLEGVVEGGQIRLKHSVALPENARVFVIVSEGAELDERLSIRSPRLAHPEAAADFEPIVTRLPPDESV